MNPYDPTAQDQHLQQLEANRKLNLLEQYEQREVLRAKPLHVAVPTGDRCNLRCVFCTDRSPTSVMRYTNLPYERFTEFTKPLENALLVQLYGWGEPFFNASYEKMFDHVTAQFPGSRIQISTNGVLLTERWVEKILDYGKCLVNISLNAATAETYAQITRRNLFDRVVANVRRLTASKAERQVADLMISLSLVAIRPNVHELPQFIELSRDLGIQYVIIQDLGILESRHSDLFLGGEFESQAHDYFEIALQKAQEAGIYLDSFTHHPVSYFMQDRLNQPSIDIPHDCLAIWEQDEEPLFYPQWGECYEPWQTFLVSQNGAVSTCCRSREIMGNIFEQSFEEIWNGDTYRAYRRSINTFRPPAACLDCPVKNGCDIR